MDLWLRLRFLEDRNCADYSKCFNRIAFKTLASPKYNYIPCYYCNGGTLMLQTFFCPSCGTIWQPENNDWVVTKIVTCAFCNKMHQVNIQLKAGQLVGTIRDTTNQTKIG